ncbi:Hpt domain-containing protein [Thaumasiovibrio subtropicus]|uniref:Hpt domain-containing protein n=1 Tax=Thaumasiovibrio subtropicus TaxID=1891207 RepID=UPI000B35FCB1|nr:Hpt domain-containing protein [Thaumasiovibrio subtropicus]
MINFEELAGITGGDDDILHAIIGMYLEEHGSDEQLLIQQLDTGDVENMFHTVHTLKGALRSMCESETAEILDNIEVLTKSGQLPNPDLLQSAITGLGKIKDQLNQQLTI